MRHIQTISLFPAMFQAVLSESMMWKAQDRGAVSFGHIDLREFGIGPRRQVDDTPYGGGDGMLLKPEPLVAAIEAAKAKQAKSHKQQGLSSTDHHSSSPKAILLTPRGQKFTQAKAKQLAESDDDLVFVCARYEGYDERVRGFVDEEISVGDYVLTGGELPAMVVIDSVVRLLPGVLGGESSAEIESFSQGDNLEYPQYTRPASFRGMEVPEVLQGGNHGEIAKWREEHSG